jgi:hypothetical protein
MIMKFNVFIIVIIQFLTYNNMYSQNILFNNLLSQVKDSYFDKRDSLPKFDVEIIYNNFNFSTFDSIVDEKFNCKTSVRLSYKNGKIVKISNIINYKNEKFQLNIICSIHSLDIYSISTYRGNETNDMSTYKNGFVLHNNLNNTTYFVAQIDFFNTKEIVNEEMYIEMLDYNLTPKALLYLQDEKISSFSEIDYEKGRPFQTIYYYGNKPEKNKELMKISVMDLDIYFNRNFYIDPNDKRRFARSESYYSYFSFGICGIK